MDQDIPALKRQLLQLIELRDAGALTAEQYEQSKATVERRLLDRIMSGELPPSEPPVASAATAAPADTAIRPPAAPTATPSVDTAARPSMRLLGALLAFVLVVACGGYWWTRTPPASAEAAANAGDAAGGEAAPHSATPEQIEAMLQKLATRLKEKPDDAAGWGMLARSYSVLGRNPEALEAYAKAAALSKDDAALLADYADALAVKNNRVLAGEPMQMVQRALKIDPRNIKALALAGTDAFVRKDFPLAVKYWDQVVAIGPADNLFVQQVQSGLVEARQLGGLPPAERPAGSSLADLAAGKAPAGAAPAAPATAAAAAATGATVKGTVTLATALAGKAAPTDTLFITARTPQGSRMPLAVIRKQVKDLPLSFVLDDSLAMSPAARISGAAEVIVTARVSKSGNAMSQPGDLIGQSAPVKVGVTGLALEIRDTVKP